MRKGEQVKKIPAKAKKKLKSIPKDAFLKFKTLLDVFRGREDIRQKLAFLFNPTNIRTATRLNQKQVEFVSQAYTLAKFYDELEPVKELADQLMWTTPSTKGQRVDEAIRFQQATSEQTDKGMFGFLADLTGSKDKPKDRRESKD